MKNTNIKRQTKSLFVTTLIIAIMLVAALSTATFAWFSANTTVSVTTTTVTAAKSDNANIGIGWTLDEANNGKTITFDSTALDAVGPKVPTTMPVKKGQNLATEIATHKYITTKNLLVANQFKANALPGTANKLNIKFISNEDISTSLQPDEISFYNGGNASDGYDVGGKKVVDITKITSTATDYFDDAIVGTDYYRIAVRTNYYYLGDITSIWDVQDITLSSEAAAKISSFNDGGVILTIGSVTSGATITNADANVIFPGYSFNNDITRIYKINEPILIPESYTTLPSRVVALGVINGLGGFADYVYITTTKGYINTGDITDAEAASVYGVVVDAGDRYLYEKTNDVKDDQAASGTKIAPTSQLAFGTSPIDTDGRFTTPANGGISYAKQVSTSQEYFYIKNNSSSTTAIDIYIGGEITGTNASLLRIAVFVNDTYIDTLATTAANTYYGAILATANGTRSLSTYSATAINIAPALKITESGVTTIIGGQSLKIAVVVWFDGVGLIESGAGLDAQFTLSFDTH
ncbi:MAG: hypothetical protein LBT55_07920 [Clostridiaceae bacterium]|jgi:hypothetical protein|nr:hypothetical protein [Clostridiaceae bacterium]